MSGKIVRRPAVVLVLGKAGVGKSTFIRAATGLEVQVGDNLHACTLSSEAA